MREDETMAHDEQQAMSEERLAEIRAEFEWLSRQFDPRRREHAVCEAGMLLLAEVEALRTREAAAMEIIEKLAAFHGDQDWVGDDENGGWGWLTERIEPLVNQACALLASAGEQTAQGEA